MEKVPGAGGQGQEKTTVGRGGESQPGQDGAGQQQCDSGAKTATAATAADTLSQQHMWLRLTTRQLLLISFKTVKQGLLNSRIATVAPLQLQRRKQKLCQNN